MVAIAFIEYPLVIAPSAWMGYFPILFLVERKFMTTYPIRNRTQQTI